MFLAQSIAFQKITLNYLEGGKIALPSHIFEKPYFHI